MMICEYCGRAHQATEIDRRFCSLLCRTQYDEHPFFYSPDALLEQQRQQGLMLRTYLVTISQSARQLLLQSETLNPEQQLINQRQWLTNIAAQENQMLSLSHTFEVPVPMVSGNKET